MFKRQKIKSFICMLALCITGTLVISGCSNNNGATGHRVLDKSTYATAQPSDFDGPYASEMAKVVSLTQSDFIYNVFKDSKISDQELQESQEDFKKCVNSRGYQVKFGGADVRGAYLIEIPGYGDGDGGVPASAADLDETCNKATGYMDISDLYYRMLWNPTKEDLTSYSAECLVKLGYEKEGYTAEQYKKDWGGYTYQGGYGDPGQEPGGGEMGNKLDPNRDKNKPIIPETQANMCALNPKFILNGK
jgi:hypothetical protein